MSKVAVILQTHFINTYIEKMYAKLCTEAPAECDVYILYNCGDRKKEIPASAVKIMDRIIHVSTADLLELGYPSKCNPLGWRGDGWALVPGNCDLNLLFFYKKHPNYDHYWAIEYDVHFSGKWSTLIDAFKYSSSDLLGTTIYRASDTPTKILYPHLKDPSGKNFDLGRAVRGFYPIMRASKRALALLDSEYTKGWDGHQELLIGTILSLNGLEIEDIGGSGEFVKKENEGRFYFNSLHTYSLSPGTFVFRPSFKYIPPFKNMLWHPFKPEGRYFRRDDQIAMSRLQKIAANVIKPIISHVLIYLWGIKVMVKSR